MAQSLVAQVRARVNDHLILQFPKGKGMDTPPALEVPPAVTQTTAVAVEEEEKKNLKPPFHLNMMLLSMIRMRSVLIRL